MARPFGATNHGLSRTAEWRCWAAIKRRCYNPKVANFKYYGGRGITVCDRWLHSFANFLSDMGPRPDGTSIDRKDNNLGYSPENCVWSTPKVQLNNRRNVRRVTYEGETATVSEWAERLGVPAKRFYDRVVSRKLPVEIAIQPIRRITYEHAGKVHTLKEWSAISGIRYPALWLRLRKGWAFADAIGPYLRAWRDR